MFEVSLVHYIVLSILLFCIGLCCVMVSRNLLRIFMGIELMLNAVNINLAAFAYFCDGMVLSGQVFILFVMAISVCEMAIGLVIVAALSRHAENIDVNSQNVLEDKQQ